FERVPEAALNLRLVYKVIKSNMEECAVQPKFIPVIDRLKLLSRETSSSATVKIDFEYLGSI
ncbi:hypothetical protein PMAYCL1PPCAC_21443, partial [Pristionchus mayeri]